MAHHHQILLQFKLKFFCILLYLQLPFSDELCNGDLIGTNTVIVCFSYLGYSHFMATDIPVTVSASGSQPRESPYYPSSVVLSPVKNKELSVTTGMHVFSTHVQPHVTATATKETLSTSTLPLPLSTVTSSRMSPIQSHGVTSQNTASNDNSSLPINNTFPKDKSTSQMPSLADNMLAAPAPPPLNSALQPRPFSLMSQDRGRIPNDSSTSSVSNRDVVKPPLFNGDGQNTQGGVCKDPSDELVQQHNVRVVPAVLSFDSPSLFSPSTCAEQSSLSLSNILQSSSEMLVSSGSSSGSTTKPIAFSQSCSSKNAPTCSKKLLSSNQPVLYDNHSQGVIWSHPHQNKITGKSPQWSSEKSSYLDIQVSTTFYCYTTFYSYFLNAATIGEARFCISVLGKTFFSLLLIVVREAKN